MYLIGYDSVNETFYIVFEPTDEVIYTTTDREVAHQVCHDLSRVGHHTYED